VLYSGVACITDLMVKEGLINLDFADVRSVMREMGKAMMGTGEASGDGRAMAAAEAAISNPLLDETSMKGARGLLISITGGRDLTLFEVDEAATRIREEVDSDANIILGATFDESLEGVIRVSVVATGIDKQPNEVAAPIQIRQAPPKQVAAQPRPVQAEAPRAEQPRQIDPVAAAIRMAELNAEAARAQAAADDFRPQSKLFQNAPAPVEVPLAQAPIPVQPVVEAPMQVMPRMPRVEDFPPVVKAEVDASQNRVAAAPAADHADRGPVGLINRIASALTSSRREEEPAKLQPAQPREPRLKQPAPEARRLGNQDPQLYAPRRGQLDEHGRVAPQPRAVQDDDQLEIPAFLRRQAN
jgi:cell division protein FtsZ